MLHKLKIEPEYFKPMLKGLKTFEIQKNNCNFKVGDQLILQEYDYNKKKYTGRKLSSFITYITDYAQKDSYVVMSIRKIEDNVLISD